VALTFDDGPDPRFTPHILEILRSYQAYATFFVVGKRAAQFPELIRMMVAAGHEIGNHTYSHRPLWLLGPEATRREIDRGAGVIANLTGQPSRRGMWWGSCILTVTALAIFTRAMRDTPSASPSAERWFEG
jgi:peptidoglycan/xylan/chitin deacetylase (PgdA/CDA1 family)